VISVIWWVAAAQNRPLRNQMSRQGAETTPAYSATFPNTRLPTQKESPLRVVASAQATHPQTLAIRAPFAAARSRASRSGIMQHRVEAVLGVFILLVCLFACLIRHCRSLSLFC
jgi:hypothetical protein